VVGGIVAPIPKTKEKAACLDRTTLKVWHDGLKFIDRVCKVVGFGGGKGLVDDPGNGLVLLGVKECSVAVGKKETKPCNIVFLSQLREKGKQKKDFSPDLLSLVPARQSFSQAGVRRVHGGQ